MTIRATPTLTTCQWCDVRMAAVRGPFSLAIGRAKPPEGYRLGFIIEQAECEIPVCRACLANLLPSSTEQGRNAA